MDLFDVLFAKKLAGGGDYPAIIKRVTGNPVEFTDGASAPLIECISEITGTQDLHGQTHPWVGGAGINKLDPSTKTTTNTNTYFYMNQGFELKSGRTYTLIFYGDTSLSGMYINTYPDNSRVTALYNTKILTYTATEDMYVWFEFYKSGEIPHDDNLYMLIEGSVIPTSWSPYENICPITAYTEGEIEVRGKNLVEETYANGNINANGIIVANIRDYDLQIGKVKEGVTYTITTNELFVGAFYYTKPTADSVSYNGSRVVDMPKTFTAPITGYVAFRTAHNYATPQLEEGESATPYEPYKGVTHTTTFPSAIYRGSEDVVNGSVTQNRIKTTYTGTNNIGAYSSGATRIPIIYLSSGVNGDTDAITNQLENKLNFSEVVENPGSFCIVTGSGYAGILLHFNGYIGADWTTSDIQSILSNENLELVRTLPTPTTTPVEITNLPVKSLSGYNHIESTTGDLDITYLTEGYQEFVDEIESTYGRRKGGKKPIDVFRMLEGDSEPKEEEGEKEEQKVDKR